MNSVGKGSSEGPTAGTHRDRIGGNHQNMRVSTTHLQRLTDGKEGNSELLDGRGGGNPARCPKICKKKTTGLLGSLILSKLTTEKTKEGK